MIQIDLMVAGIGAGLQRIIQISRHQIFRRIRRCTGNDLNLILGKQLLGTLSHAAGNNHLGALFGNPFG